MKKPQIAIVYDRLNTFGGAERVLLALHDAFPRSILFTSVRDRNKTKWLGDWKVYTSFLQYFPFAAAHHQWFGWLMPVVFESLDLRGFDIVISVTSEAAKGVITTPDQLHICYCLTPTRYLWSHTHEYEGANLRAVKRWMFHRLREWDFIAATRPDLYIPISTVVQRRIEKYYRRTCAPVIYPSVEIQNSKFQIPNEKTKDYFLVVSRLVPYKKVDLVIETCLKLHKKLVIVGTGTDESRLRALAGGSPLIEFLGFVDQKSLDEIYRKAKALICAQEEDFGIVSLEAQKHGTPVLTYAHSGVAETIILGKTGLLFEKQTEESLSQALMDSEKIQWDAKFISHSVQKFDTVRFIHEFQEFVEAAYTQRQMKIVL